MTLLSHPREPSALAPRWPPAFSPRRGRRSDSSVRHARRTDGQQRCRLNAPFGQFLYLRRTASIPDEALRIVRGNIGPDGSKQPDCTGEFEAERYNSASYRITFTRPFATTPTIVTTAFQGPFIANVHRAEPGQVVIVTHDHNGVGKDAAFHFIAVG